MFVTTEHWLGGGTKWVNLGVYWGTDRALAGSRLDEPSMCGVGLWMPGLQGEGGKIELPGMPREGRGVCYQRAWSTLGVLISKGVVGNTPTP